MIQLPPPRRNAVRLAGALAAVFLAAGSPQAEEVPLAEQQPAVASVAGEEAGEAWRLQVEELALANEELGRQNALLRDRLGDLRQQLDAAGRAGQDQRARDQRRWFVTGAAVLLAGLLLGLLLSRLRMRRRSRWGDL